ncbi:hypothetical protein Dimus_038378 [Dionaea muscipula]
MVWQSPESPGRGCRLDCPCRRWTGRLSSVWCCSGRNPTKGGSEWTGGCCLPTAAGSNVCGGNLLRNSVSKLVIIESIICPSPS